MHSATAQRALPSMRARALCAAQNVEAMLGDQWASLRQARRVRGPPRGGLGRALLLLNRMRFFIKRYLAFVFVEVVRPQWHAMCERVASASSLDQARPCLSASQGGTGHGSHLTP